MNRPKHNFVNIDALSRSVSIEQVLTHFGLVHEIAHRTGNEIRTRCFLNCGKSESTGDRALAIKDEDVKRWCCHQYSCPHKTGGNLVGLIDLMLPGENGNGRPRGDRFKEVLQTLQQITGTAQITATTVALTPQSSKAEPPKVNIPLAESANERARGLVNLHEKFLTDPARMNPAAASYFRRRTYLTADVAAQWRMGYLPRDTGGDASGGTMRGKIVYQLHDHEGHVIGYCGRDPDFERKHAAWIAAGREGNEPAKVSFPKGFHKGLFLYGEQRLQELAVIEQIKFSRTLWIVEGPNDVIRLSLLGIPAVASCGNRLTDEQADRLSGCAREFDVPLTLLFGLDPEGEHGMRAALWTLAERCAVRVGWSRGLLAGRFQNRQPESLSQAEWSILGLGSARAACQPLQNLQNRNETGIAGTRDL